MDLQYKNEISFIYGMSAVPTLLATISVAIRQDYLFKDPFDQSSNLMNG